VWHWLDRTRVRSTEKSSAPSKLINKMGTTGKKLLDGGFIGCRGKGENVKTRKGVRGGARGLRDRTSHKGFTRPYHKQRDVQTMEKREGHLMGG